MTRQILTITLTVIITSAAYNQGVRNTWAGTSECKDGGVVMVQLEDFGVLGHDRDRVTYHLTPIGEFAHLRIVQEAHLCFERDQSDLYPCFIVGGGYKGLRFSWMVTAPIAWVEPSFLVDSKKIKIK